MCILHRLKDNKVNMMFKPVLYTRRWFVLAAYCLLTTSNLSAWCAFSSISNIVQRYYSINLIQVNWLAIIVNLIALFLMLPANYYLKLKGLSMNIVLSSFFNAFGCCIRYTGYSFMAGSGYWFLFAGKWVGLVLNRNTFLLVHIFTAWLSLKGEMQEWGFRYQGFGESGNRKKGEQRNTTRCEINIYTLPKH